MSVNLETLEQVFHGTWIEESAAEESAAEAEVTSRYEARLRSLLSAEGGKWRQLLDGVHEYASDSEAIMAVICAMTARHFTAGEIRQTLLGARVFVARIERKGDRHARELIEKEIVRARATVTPFDDDPGVALRVRIGNSARQVDAAAIDAAVLSANGRDTRSSAAPLNPAEGLDPASFVARYVALGLRRTDAPATAHEAMAVAVLSALAGPAPRLPIATEAGGWRLALWVMYIAASTFGRKTTVLEFARAIITAVLGENAVLNWEGSPQGILQRLQEQDGKATVFVRDEYSGLMAQMNRGGHLAGLPQLFIRSFDGKPLENVRTRKKNADGEKIEDTDRVTNPYLVKATASVFDAFVERCTIDNVLDGYLARFIFVTGRATPQPVKRLTPDIIKEHERLVESAREFHAKAKRLSLLEITDAVLERNWNLEQDWAAEALHSSRPDAAAPALKRLSESVLKVAALLAIDGTDPDTTPVVTAADYAHAQRMGEGWKQAALDVIEKLGQTSFMREMAALRQTIIGSPTGIAMHDLLRRHPRLRARDFSEILELLEAREEIEVVAVRRARGRPARVLFPFGHAPTTDAGDR